MVFDKKMLYKGFLYVVAFLFATGTLCYIILLSWAVLGDGLFYAVYEPLPFPYLWNHPVTSAAVGFLVYFVALLYAVRELFVLKRRVKTENGI